MHFLSDEREWTLDAGVMDGGVRFGENVPAWIREIGQALPAIVAENKAAPRHVPVADSRPAKRPRGHRRAENIDAAVASVSFSGVEGTPELDGAAVDNASREEDDSRERAVLDGESLADAETVKRFTGTLESLIERVDALAEKNGGDITSARLGCTSRADFMKELLQNVQIHSQLSVVALVPPATLALTLAALEIRVLAGGKDAASMTKQPPTSELLLKIELALYAAAAILSILTAPEVPRTLLVQDTLDSVIVLLRNACAYVLYPLSDPMYDCPWAKSENGLENDGEDAESARAKKRPEPILRACCGVYDALAQLLRREQGFADSFVAQAVSLAIPSLGVDGVVPLQIAAGKVVEAIASSYPEQDWTLVDDLREQLSKMPSNRRSLRAYRVDDGKKQVRVASAILVQALNVIGGRTRANLRTSVLTPEEAPDELRKRVMRLSFRLVDEMLSRTFLDRDSEYRFALQAFFADLLDLFALPEWPSAEPIVQALGLRLVVMLNKGSELSVHARVVCLDMLGSLAARICVLFCESALQAGDVATNNVWADRKLRKLVLQKRVSVLLFLQEQAKSDPSSGFAQLFHCAQFVVDDADACEASHKAEHAMRKLEDENLEDISSDDISRLRRDAMEVGSRALTDTFQALRGSYDGDRSSAVSAALFVSQRRTFSRQLHKIVDTVRDGLQQPEPTLRAKAIKTLSLIAEAQPAVLRNVPSLIPAIEASCMDVSKSVREASLDLLSRSVVSLRGFGSAACPSVSTPPGASSYGASFFERVFPIVQQRLLDSATSVRKRAIAIMHGVLMDAMAQLSVEGDPGRESRQDLNSIIVRVCCTLADRLEDRETSVRESAERTLRLSLFGFDHTRLGDNMSRAQEEEAALIYASRLVSVFVAIIRNPQASPSQRNVVGRVLHDAILIKRRSLLCAIVSEVAGLLCGTEARLADTVQTPLAKETAQRKQETLAFYEKRLACTSVLEAISKVEPGMVAPYCQTLLPYLSGVSDSKRRNWADLVNLSRVLNTLEVCIPVAGRGFDGLDEVIRDVDKIVCVCPAPFIAQPAVKCLCALARHAKDPELSSLPEDTARMFYDFLFSSRDELTAADASTMSEAMRNAKQALPRLGLLARYGDFSEEFVADIFGILQHLCNSMMWEWMKDDQLEDALCRVASGGSSQQRQPFALRLGVVRSMTYFLVRHRSYLPQATPLLVAALSQGGEVPDYDAQTTVLSGLQEMLVEEETRNLAAAKKIGNDQRQSKPGAKRDVVLAAEEDVEAGHLALCAQAVMPELGKAASSENADVRKAVVAVLGLLVRQGLVLPAKVVPALFGLLVDGSSQCRDSALLVVSFLADRYPGMLSSAAMIGIRNTFQHAMLTRSNVAMTDALQHICRSAVNTKTGYALLSPALTQIQRDQRRGILCGIAREFDPRAKRVTSRGAKAASERQDTDAMDVDDIDGVGSGNSAEALDGQGVNGAAGVTLPRTCIDDGDVLVNDAMELVVSGVSPSIGHLAFYAFVLATMDYAGGSGVGGSLTVGGGTAAGDAKLKVAREDVLEIASVMSRIISNSGQALLESASQILQSSEARSEQEAKNVALHTVPICMLLLIKRYLKQTRWFLSAPVREEEDAGNETVVPLPSFDLSNIGLSCPELPAVGESWSGHMTVENAKAQLLVFRELMRDDLIDEAETLTNTGRRKSATPRRKRGSVTISRQSKKLGRTNGSRTRASGSRGGSRGALVTQARDSVYDIPRVRNVQDPDLRQIAVDGEDESDDDFGA
jgi:Sister chromatid cohesion C-terminus/HEAT repeat associated with sister chromatid cohesion